VCAAAIATDGKFKSPFASGATPADYIGSGNTCSGTATAGKLLVIDPVPGSAAGVTPVVAAVEGKVIACNKDGNAYTDASYSDASFGTTW